MQLFHSPWKYYSLVKHSVADWINGGIAHEIQILQKQCSIIETIPMSYEHSHTRIHVIFNNSYTYTHLFDVSNREKYDIMYEQYIDYMMLSILPIKQLRDNERQLKCQKFRLLGEWKCVYIYIRMCYVYMGITIIAIIIALYSYGWIYCVMFAVASPFNMATIWLLYIFNVY